MVGIKKKSDRTCRRRLSVNKTRRLRLRRAAVAVARMKKEVNNNLL